MNSVYVVFARTDLKVGRMIRIMTRNRYNQHLGKYALLIEIGAAWREH